VDGREVRDGMGDEARRRTMGRPGVLPGGADWRLALRAYVAGHDRGSDLERKLDDALRASVRAEGSRPGRGAGAPGAEGAPSMGSEGSGLPPLDVPVPARLDFHRGAGNWRTHLPGGAGRVGPGDGGGRPSRGPGRESPDA